MAAAVTREDGGVVGASSGVSYYHNITVQFTPKRRSTAPPGGGMCLIFLSSIRGGVQTFPPLQSTMVHPDAGSLSAVSLQHVWL